MRQKAKQRQQLRQSKNTGHRNIFTEYHLLNKTPGFVMSHGPWQKSEPPEWLLHNYCWTRQYGWHTLYGMQKSNQPVAD